MRGKNTEASGQNKEKAKARNYVWRLIKQRMRSEEEVKQKLNFKKYAPCVIAETVSYFKDLDYINDLEFAQRWVNSRLRKPLALKAIAVELIKKGIAKEIIDALIKEKRSGLDERGMLEEIAQKYFNKSIKRKESLEKIKARLYGYLFRRGFSSEAVIDAINQLKIKT